MKLSVKVIGTDPPCPRCHRTYELVAELAEELGIDVELKKLVAGTEEAERYGRCVSLKQFAEFVDEQMPDVSDELARGDAEGLDRKAKPLLDRHPDSGLVLAPAVVINDDLKFFGQVPQKEDLREALWESIEGDET
ncbi:MAG: thioredoxin family protein [Methanophagales archaeon]|nr:thioredoxin family protein [Methanophagales archaeon]